MCPSELCDENYKGEIGRRIIAERVKGHNGRDHKSHILIHSQETGHEHVMSSDFSVISKNCNGNKRKQKIAEPLFIKQLCPTLNIHDKSVMLKLFKGYLFFKMITSQNVSSEAQVKNFFISQKSYIPFSSYLSFCIFNHPIIYQISDVMISIST